MGRLASGKIEGKVVKEDVEQWFADQKDNLLKELRNACQKSSDLRIEFQENIGFNPEECKENEVKVSLQFDAQCEAD
jgi:hypothetical protein